MGFTTILSPTEVRNWFVYRFTSPSGRIYVGITSDVNKRMSVYKSKAKSRQTLIFNSIKKYGYENHQLDIIDTFTADFNYAADKEMFWIRSYMSNKNKFPDQNGLNLTDGGDGTMGYKMSPELIEHHRKIRTGKKTSEETKKKLSLANKGRKMNFTHFTPEFRKMMSEKNKGYKHTEEAKKKIGDASRGNKHRLGHKMTPEQIEHRSSKIRGNKIKPEIVAQRKATFIKKYGKPVFQYSLDGNLINSFPSITIASKELGIPRLGIYRNLVGMYKQSRGFMFKYK